MSRQDAGALPSAIRYLRCGLSVMPIKPSRGSGKDLQEKDPVLRIWKPLQTERADEATINGWYADDSGSEYGVAVIAGRASGNLGVFDVEFMDYHDAWRKIVEDVAPGLFDRLPRVLTPGKDDSRGMHLYCRCEVPVAAGKVARLSEEEALARTGDVKRSTAIEIRGANHYVLAPGSPAGCHHTGRTYEWVHLGPEEIPTLSIEEFKILKGAALKLDLVPQGKVKEADAKSPEPVPMGEGEMPGSSFNRTAEWADLLERHGWALVASRGAIGYWSRPGKGKGVSATTGFCRTDRSGDMLYVFSTNAEPLQSEKAYSKFAALCALEHGGDYNACAKQLSHDGYGDPPVRRMRTIGETDEIVAVEVLDDIPPTVGGDEAASDTAEWPDRLLPPVLEDYARELAATMACPIDFPAAAMLTIAAAAIGACRAVEYHRAWQEYPRIFLALVSEPGIGKSPAVQRLLKPVSDRQNTIHAGWLARKEHYLGQVLDYEASCKSYAARKLKEKMSDDDSPPKTPERPIYEHLYTTNATTEALVPMLVDNPRGFLLYRDEIAGWLEAMNQYKGGKGDDRQFWLEVWGGSYVKVDRRGNYNDGPLIADNPFMSILGGIQPSRLNTLEPSKGDGFVDRILFVYPRKTPWPERIGPPPSEAAEKAWSVTLGQLWKMEYRKVGTANLPVAVPFDCEGREVADQWYAAHAREVNCGRVLAPLDGVWSKLKSYYFRLCLVIHCLRAACGDLADAAAIDAETAMRAVALMDYLKKHQRKVYARFSGGEAGALADRAAEWISRRDGRSATARDVVRARIVPTTQEAEALFEDMAGRLMGVYTQPERPLRGGKPKCGSFCANTVIPEIIHMTANSVETT